MECQQEFWWERKELAMIGVFYIKYGLLASFVPRYCLSRMWISFTLNSLWAQLLFYICVLIFYLFPQASIILVSIRKKVYTTILSSSWIVVSAVKVHWICVSRKCGNMKIMIDNKSFIFIGGTSFFW